SGRCPGCRFSTVFGWTFPLCRRSRPRNLARQAANARRRTREPIRAECIADRTWPVLQGVSPGMRADNYFSTNKDLTFYYEKVIDWQRLVPLFAEADDAVRPSETAGSWR